MDWSSVSRLVPEVGVLVVAGYFALKGISIFKDIVDRIDKQHHDALSKLSSSIDKNTSSNDALIKASREQTKASKDVHEFMKNLNGKLTTITNQTIKEQNVSSQRVEHQSIDSKEN